MLFDFSTMFEGYSRFPNDKDCFSTIYARHLTIFGSVALPLAFLGAAGVFPPASHLIFGWAFFWLGIFRFWLRDVQLDDEALKKATEGYPRWMIPLVTVLAYAMTIVDVVLITAILDKDPRAVFLVGGYTLLAASSLYWTVVHRSLRLQRRQVKALARANRPA